MLIIVLWGTFTGATKIKCIRCSNTILLIFEYRSDIEYARNGIVCQGNLYICWKIGYGVKFKSHPVPQRLYVLLRWDHFFKRYLHPFYVILHIHYTFSSVLSHLDIFGWPIRRPLSTDHLPLFDILLHHLYHKPLFFSHLSYIFRIIDHLFRQFEQIRVYFHERPMYFILVLLWHHLCHLQASRLLTAFLTLHQGFLRVDPLLMYCIVEVWVLLEMRRLLLR